MLVSSTFNGLERTVIEIGKRDPTATLMEGGRWRRLIPVILGVRPPPPLANPRLEALRTLVIALD